MDFTFCSCRIDELNLIHLMQREECNTISYNELCYYYYPCLFFTYLFTLVCMDINWHLYGEAHLPPGIWPEPCLIMRTQTVTWTSVYDASRDMVTDFTLYAGVMDGRTNTWWQPKDTLTMSEIINRHSVLNTPSKIDVVASFVEPYGWTIRVIGEESLILVHSPGIYDRAIASRCFLGRICTRTWSE